MKSIAIIDDDVHIGNMLEETLQKEGYRVLRAYSGTEALYLMAQNRPDLVLLDLMLPGLSGEEILPQIQGIPVIVLSAKADVQDKVNLLLGGAVDYVTKPFHTKELLARITAQLRSSAGSNPASSPDLLHYSDLMLNPSTHEVAVNNIPVRLTRTEYAILKSLLENSGQVLTKSSLLDHICADTPDCTENSLKIHVSNLRKKLRNISGKEYIESVWGIGFKLL